MYRMTGSHGPQDHLGFSLKPPKWLRNLVGGTTSAATQAKDAADEIQRVADAAGGKPPSGGGMMFDVNQPSSWLMPAALVGLGFLLLRKR